MLTARDTDTVLKQFIDKVKTNFGSSSNTSTLDKIRNRGTLRVGTTADFLPFSYINKQTGSNEGLDIALAQNLADSLDVELTIVDTTWPTLLEELLQGKFDIAMSGVSITLDRQRSALFSNPILKSGKAAIAREQDAKRFISIEAINQPDVRVIVNRGGTNEKFARTHFRDANLQLSEDNMVIFKKIANNEADVMVTDAIETLVQQHVYPGLKAVNPDTPFDQFEFGFMMDRDHTFKEYIDQWLRIIKENATYDQLYKQAFDNILQDQSAIQKT